MSLLTIIRPRGLPSDSRVTRSISRRVGLITGPFILALTLSLAGCPDEPAMGTPEACPEGPSAPLDAPCTTEDLVCAYGYEPLECGGRTLICQSGIFIELRHTDPAPSCFADGGAPDGS